MILLFIIVISVGEPEQGAETFYREPEPVKKLWGAGSIKPYLVGAGAEAGKNPLNTVPRSRAFLESDPV